MFSSDMIDGRSSMSRRFGDLLAAFIANLRGSDRMSEAQRQLARRIADVNPVRGRDLRRVNYSIP
jgi:hypothetical protein